MLRRLIALVVAFVFGSCLAGSKPTVPKPPSGTGVIAFVHADVVPMDEERVLRDQTVVVADGAIVALGPASTVKVPDDAFRVDATGKYLVPALCDMHVHLLGPAWGAALSPEALAASKDLPYEEFLLPYVANGVTTVQVLSATAEDLAVRGRIERGEMLGPRLILAPMIDGPGRAWPPPISNWVGSPDEAREAVRRMKADGYDKVKVYSFLDQGSYDAIVATAGEVGMDVIGHVPMDLSVEYVLEAGQKLVAHSEEIAKHAHGDYSAERVEYFATLMEKHGVWMTPTLVTTRRILEVLDDPDGYLARPEAAFFQHPMQRGVWSFIAHQLYQPIPAEARQDLRDAFDEFQRPLTGALRDSGKLMTGSDAVIPGVMPGFDLHAELRELVDVGLTPFEALRASTTAPFEYLGERGERGTIAVGQRSDLFLLDANPLDDVSAASQIAGVLIRGRWLGSDELRERMRALAAEPGP